MLQVNLAEKLVTYCAFADKAFFTNSGTEANEAAIKFARKFARVRGKLPQPFCALTSVATVVLEAFQLRCFHQLVSVFCS